MAKRVLCEMVTEEFTGIEYPTPYAGNCFYTSDSKALRDFKKEVLAEHPEMKGKLKVVSAKTAEDKAKAVFEARDRDRGYQEWKAYKTSTGAWM